MGSPFKAPSTGLEQCVRCLELRVRGWLVRYIPAVPDSGDLGRLSNPRGPGFEPLISKASECDSFKGKETPEGIFRLDSKTTQSYKSRARVFRWWWATWPDSCGAVRARLFGRQPRADEAAWAVADGWDSATVAPCPPVTVPQLLLRARVGDSVVVGPSRQRQRNLPHSMR